MHAASVLIIDAAAFVWVCESEWDSFQFLFCSAFWENKDPFGGTWAARATNGDPAGQEEDGV